MIHSFFFGNHPAVEPAPRQPWSGREAASLVGLLLAATVVLAWRWVGYQGTDDAYYADAAFAWLAHFPALGDNHWSLRYPVVLPAAAFMWLLGPSTFSLAAANLAYFAALMAVTYLGCRRFLGWPVAVLATAAVVLMPAVVVQGTYANPDLPEALFVVASFWAFVTGVSRRGNWRWLLLAGALAGFGYLTREIGVAVVIFYALLFLGSPQMPRIRYLVIGAGCLLVVGAQLTDFAVRAQTPFYRLQISSHHDSPDRTAIAPRGNGRVLDAEGVLATGAILTPVSALLVSQKFGLLFWIAIPATVFVARSRRVAAPARRVALLAAGLALTWFLFVAVNAAMLYVVPRYFIAVGVAAAVPAALALVTLWQGRWRWLVALVGTGFATSCLLLLYLENTDPLHAELLLVDAAATTVEPLFADPRTAGRAALLLRLRGLAVDSGPPPAGALVAINPRAAQLCTDSRYCGARDRMPPYEVKPDWVIVREMPAPTRWIGGLLRAAGLAPLVPPDIMRKVESPYDGLVVYRLPR